MNRKDAETETPANPNKQIQTGFSSARGRFLSSASRRTDKTADFADVGKLVDSRNCNNDTGKAREAISHDRHRGTRRINSRNRHGHDNRRVTQREEQSDSDGQLAHRYEIASD